MGPEKSFLDPCCLMFKFYVENLSCLHFNFPGREGKGIQVVISSHTGWGEGASAVSGV